MKVTKNVGFSTIYQENNMVYVTIALHLASVEDRSLLLTLLTVN